MYHLNQVIYKFIMILKISYLLSHNLFNILILNFLIIKILMKIKNFHQLFNFSLIIYYKLYLILRNVKIKL